MERTPGFTSAVLRMTGLSGSLAIVLFAGTLTARAQRPPSALEIDRARVMLRTIKEDLKKNYYDPAYHGMDLEARFKTADEKLKTAASLGQLMGIIARVLLDLNDSHTFFLPPDRADRTEYGWQAQAIGDKCYVVSVKPGSDAENKGLKAGDQIVSVDGNGLDRQNMWIFNYLYHALRPTPGMRLEVVKLDGKHEQLDVLAKIQKGKRVMDVSGEDDGSDIFDLIREGENESRLHRHRYIELGDDFFIWKMPGFDLQRDKVDGLADKFRKRKGLILDLRGNGGGALETLLRLLGNLFDHDVTVGDFKGRKDQKPALAKTRGSNAFNGKLIVLIDSESGSAAELLARVVQLEKRGTIIGDRSAGAVMVARHFDHQSGVDVAVPYGVSITEADMIMADGKSLERVGVTPDEIKLPTAADLAAQRDPVLAYAASLLGVAITPEKAGSFFPIEWRK
jgi:C-terminal processing protease CtpA/Prc